MTGSGGVAAALLVAAGALSLMLGHPAAAAQPPAPRALAEGRLAPDVIVVIVDDQRAGTERAMPFTRSFFDRPRGVWYSNTQVPTNLCCPSRTALLTGRYPTSTGAWENDGGQFGGAQPMRRWEYAAVPYWLHDSGYRTGLFGKYVNGFKGPRTPPGWDTFNVFEGPGGSGYTAVVRGQPLGYSTDVLGTAAAEFIRTAPSDAPLFAYVAPFAPHAEYNPGPYAGKASRLDQFFSALAGRWHNASFDTVTPGQPKWLRRVPPVSKPQLLSVVRQQATALLGVDANLRRITRAVARHRDLDNTLFVYMGDNGYGWGDHRLTTKRSPYVTTNEIPLLVRFPEGMVVPAAGRGRADNEDRRLANNVDVSATILAAAGIGQPTDGVPLNSRRERRRLPLMAAATVPTRPDMVARPAYCGVRTQGWTYHEYSTGEVEVYDLAADPFQIRNLAGRRSVRDHERRLRRLNDRTECDLAALDRAIPPLG